MPFSSHDDPRTAPTTVGWVFASSSVQRGRPQILSGHRALDQPVRWVHSGDLASSVALLRGGEVLLCTAAGLPVRPAEQRLLLECAIDAGLAGLVVELGPGSVSLDALLVTAGAHDLPVVVLHEIVSFADITEEAHRHIIAAETTATGSPGSADMGLPEASADKRLTNVMLAGGGVAELLKEIADIVRRPVILARHDETVVSMAAYDASSPDLVSRWRSRELRQRTMELVDIPMGGEQIWGTLAVSVATLPLGRGDRAVLDRAVELLGIALLRHREEEVLMARGCGEFIMSVLDERTDPRDLGRRAAQLGLGQREWLVPCIVRSGGALHSGEAAWSLVARDIASEWAGRRIPAVVGSLVHEAGVAMILSPRDGDRDAFVTSELVGTIRRLAARHLGGTGTVVSFGGAARSWGNVRHVLRETLDVSRHGLAQDGDEWLDATAPDLGLLMRAMKDSTVLRYFVDRRLLPLLEHDRDRRTDLIGTLETLFAHDGNKADAARALHLERQSLYHRLSKIETIIGASLADEDTRLGLQVALRAFRAAQALGTAA
jgi:purine catabolism regulator